MENALQEAEWEGVVRQMIEQHPSWVSSTVRGVQAGVVLALEAETKRSNILCLGLLEALRTKPKAKRRNTKMIIDAIKVSNFYPTVWSKEQIAKEKGGNREKM